MPKKFLHIGLALQQGNFVTLYLQWEIHDQRTDDEWSQGKRMRLLKLDFWTRERDN